MTRRDEIVRELQRLQRVAGGIQQRYQAHFMLHNAATANADKEEMGRRRDELHAVLDVLLDNGEAIAALTAELEALP